MSNKKIIQTDKGLSNTEQIAKKAKVIVSGMAMFPNEDGSVLVINLNNINYRAKLDRNGNVFASNMSDKTLAKVKNMVLENVEFF